MIRRILCLIVLGCFPLSGAEVGVDRLNVRTAPSAEAMIVASLAAGTNVDAVPVNDSWAEIPAPDGVPVWVAALFVGENGILREGARFRCGPGTVFAEYHRNQTSPGEAVSVLEKARGGFWLRIRPLPGLKCYVSRKFLKEETPQNKEKSVAKTVEPRHYVLEDARQVSVEGKLVPLKRGVMDSSYELILIINGETVPVCYLTAPRLNLKLWENRTVRIDGVQRWVKGIRRPFVEIKKVSPSWK